MGDRATCPVCGSYSSTVLYDLRNGDKCRFCGCSNNLLEDYQEILNRKDIYKKNEISNNLLEENQRLIKENCYLKNKINKVTEILGYEFDSSIISSLQKVVKIIHEDENSME